LNDPGKLQGARLEALFNELIEKKVIISIHVVGTGFERLTCIAGTEQGTTGNYLLIDRPEGFSQSAGRSEEWNLGFNFNGPDHLEYVFSTCGGEVCGNNLKIPFPEYVERLQRRKDFRILTLPGTKLVFAVNKIKGVVDLINISLGGAFGLLLKPKGKNPGGSLLALDQRLYKIGLIFPADNEMNEQLVVIKKAEVRRIEHDKERKLYKYAFEFMDMDRDQKQKLTSAIYHLQRQYLKSR
jgi:PilZ domain